MYIQGGIARYKFRHKTFIFLRLESARSFSYLSCICDVEYILQEQESNSAKIARETKVSVI